MSSRGTDSQEVNRSVAVGAVDGDELVNRSKNRQKLSSEQGSGSEVPDEDLKLMGRTAATSGKFEQAQP